MVRPLLFPSERVLEPERRSAVSRSRPVSRSLIHSIDPLIAKYEENEAENELCTPSESPKMDAETTSSCSSGRDQEDDATTRIRAIMTKLLENQERMEERYPWLKNQENEPARETPSIEDLIAKCEEGRKKLESIFP